MSKLISLAAAGLCCHAAHAVPLPNPSPLVNLDEAGTSLADEPSLGGIVVADMTTPFSFDWSGPDRECARSDFPDCPLYSGTTTIAVQSQVLRSVDGTFDFYWRISNDSTPQIPRAAPNVVVFTLTSFSSPSPFNADWRNDLPGDVNPSVVIRNGDTVTWGFGSGIRDFGTVLAGQSSNYFFLDTDAVAYSRSAFFTVDNSARYSTFAPIPEPTTYALMLVGLALTGFIARRRHRRPEGD